ncbi:MAG TPA: alanine--glyoxylate aminotransferase family protein [Verrucomicrobiota bacterium]|jgi:aspartate aminotransferase-like enzyme|nr:alanine--glyoxylate aminotransferase family protein [Verrucomicrobiota bacterium]OQC26611.1 MAG: Soluble hydrogenase 42 kDa subunit [Verrucomicrobia bacterium ADurb.Bin063]HCL91273.1 aminotransferase [Limisphaerales bacterium]HRR63843.1 alanine--glyoxylate aminotransferase family protein [Candidatus Paceibacterota bacterium]MBP8015494.1 alanine--glyoxylate aminotransferase family protein [Verrucomicrobiota bacterium]
MGHVKLHIPGPVEISEKTYRAFCQPMIGHRGQGFKDLYARIQPQLQQLLYTRQLVYLSTSSAWGVMEGAIRNLVSRKVLNCMCGAFSDKWLDVSRRCGKDAEGLQVPWGSPIRAAEVDRKLATGQFDALTVIHNETSTGVMSPLAEIAALKQKYPDVMFIVDSVSSMTAVPLKFDELGIDVLLAGTQKALAMPPGLALFVCSPAALAKAATVKDRGYYFDFVEFQKNAAQNMTPSTPSISHIYALESKLQDIFAEGLEARYARHRRTNQLTRDWAARHGFTLFPDPGFESVTLTCVNNGARPGGRVVDAEKLVKLVKDQGFLINGGYGKIKGTTFRVSNMGDETEATMNQLFAAMDNAMKQL